MLKASQAKKTLFLNPQNKKTVLQIILAFAIASLLVIVYYTTLVSSSKPKPAISINTLDDYNNKQEDLSPDNKPPETQQNSPSVSSSNTQGSTNSSVSSSTESVPAYTLETRLGQPLEYFPFPIMTDPPHSVHDPVTGFSSITQSGYGYTFVLPAETNYLGLYGQFWLSPTPPTSSAKLSGVRIRNASWSGTLDNSIVVFSLLDRQTQNNALGGVSGATQGLANELVAVLIDQQSDVIELRLSIPVSNSNERFVLAIDSENLPTGNLTTIYPTAIAAGQIEWLWQ